MQRQTVRIGSQTISFYESVGRGRSALLVHGNSSSGLSYTPQVEGSIGQEYHMVAIDLPGHGLSGRAADPASTYVLPGYADIVVAVAEQLGLLDAVFVGWSLGGNILLEASDRLSRAGGLMIIGTAPLGVPPAMAGAFLPNPALAFNFRADLGEDDVEAFARALLRPGVDPIPESYLSGIRQADPQARQVIGASLQAGEFRDEVAIIARLATPLAVVFGEREQLANSNYVRGLSIPSLWRGEVQIIPDAGHIPSYEQPALFNPLLKAFMEETARQPASGA